VDYTTPTFSSDLQKTTVPITYLNKQIFRYIFKIPLFSPTEYHGYKVLPLPVTFQQKDLTYSYIGFNKEFIFSVALRQHWKNDRKRINRIFPT
jgi:hypothetical protein